MAMHMIVEADRHALKPKPYAAEAVTALVSQRSQLSSPIGVTAAARPPVLLLLLLCLSWLSQDSCHSDAALISELYQVSDRSSPIGVTAAARSFLAEWLLLLCLSRLSAVSQDSCHSALPSAVLRYQILFT